MLKKVFVTFLLTIFAVGAMATVIPSGAENAMAEVDFSGANSVYVTEYQTGKVVYAKNENDRKPIASMVKIMTSLLTLEALDDGKVSQGDSVEISEHAASMGGSQVFLDAGDSIKLEELLKSVVVASANDSAVALAEHIGGSEDGFVSMMNKRAAELGMKDTNFVNATGLPKIGGYSTAKDVNVMTKELVKYPLYKKFCSIWLEDFKHPDGRTTVMTNTNKLVRYYKGCDLGKTGFTSEAMYCLSASAKRQGVRIVATVMGAKTSKERNALVSKLFDFGFSKFECKVVLRAEDSVRDVKVSRGKQKTVGVTLSEDLRVIAERGDDTQYRIEYVLPNKVKAPLKAGDVAGKIVVYDGDRQVAEQTLRFASSVEKSNLWDEIGKIFKEW